MMYIDYLNKHKDQLEGLTPKEVLTEVTFTVEDYYKLDKSGYPSVRERDQNNFKYKKGLTKEESERKKVIALSEMVTESVKRAERIFGSKI